MNMDVSCAALDGVIQPDVSLEPLMQISGLCDVVRNPTPILSLAGVDVIARQGLERGLHNMDLVLIFRARLPAPIDQGGRRGGGFRLLAVTEYFFYYAHLCKLPNVR